MNPDNIKLLSGFFVIFKIQIPNMKKILAVFIIFLTFNACDNRSCEEVLCGPNQVCNRGICACINGYEGANCQELSFEKYIGNFNISQSCQQGNGTFVSFGTIGSSTNQVNELLFYNFLGLGQTAYGYIFTDQSGDGNYVQFPTQNLGASTIAGEGYFQDFGGSGRLAIDIQLTQNNQTSLCTYTYF